MLRTCEAKKAVKDHGAMAQTLAYIQNTLLYPLGAQCNLAAYDQQAQLQVSSLERTLAAARPHNQPGSSAIASCSAAVQSAIADSESLLDDAAWCAIAPLFGQLLDAAALEARTVQQLLERALAANQEVADDTGLRILRVLRLAQQLPELQPCGVNVSRGMVRAFGLAVSLVDKVVAYLAGAGVEVQAEPMALPAFSRLATLVGGAAPAASRDMATHQATCTSSFVAAAASITQMFNQCRHVIGNINTGRFSALEPLCTALDTLGAQLTCQLDRPLALLQQHFLVAFTRACEATVAAAAGDPRLLTTELLLAMRNVFGSTGPALYCARALLGEDDALYIHMIADAQCAESKAREVLATLEGLQPELLAGVFSRLDSNAQHMTVALLSKSFHRWALAQRGGERSFRPQLWLPLPSHAVQHEWRSRKLITNDLHWGAVLASAAGAGDEELVQWLRQQGCPWDERACARAAGGGHLGLLQWLRSQHPPCPWDASICRHAAGGGHLDVVLWLRSQGCSWDPEVCAAAAARGHLGVLQMLRSQEPPCPWDERACMRAAAGGHLALLQWLRSQQPPCPWDQRACSAAAGNGHLQTLQWARSQVPPCPWDEDACAGAASNDQLRVLQWARSQEPPCPWDEQSCAGAVSGGCLEVLQWLRSQVPPCPWDEDACCVAAEHGDLDALQWLRDQIPPCPWDERVVACARHHSHNELLQWALVHGAPQ